jgi:hypothetical protein
MMGATAPEISSDRAPKAIGGKAIKAKIPKRPQAKANGKTSSEEVMDVVDASKKSGARKRSSSK